MLVPNYLSQVPRDPYANGPIRLKSVDDSIVFYSVGRDRRDDGGRLGSSKDYWSTPTGYDLDLDTPTRP